MTDHPDTQLGTGMLGFWSSHPKVFQYYTQSGTVPQKEKKNQQINTTTTKNLLK